MSRPPAGRARGRRRAKSLPSLCFNSRPKILCAPEAPSFPSQSRLFLARLAGQHLLLLHVLEGVEWLFPLSITLTILVQTLCKVSSCPDSAQGWEICDRHRLALLPGQLACLPFTLGARALPHCLGGFLSPLPHYRHWPVSGWEPKQVQWLGASTRSQGSWAQHSHKASAEVSGPPFP